MRYKLHGWLTWCFNRVGWIRIGRVMLRWEYIAPKPLDLGEK